MPDTTEIAIVGTCTGLFIVIVIGGHHLVQFLVNLL